MCSIGSTDPGGRAGLFRDAAVYAGMAGIEASFVVAGVTAQNDRSVRAVRPVSSSLIRRQLEAVWAQSAPDAVRIGLLPDAAACRTVSRFLGAMRKRPHIVVDPVITASSGARLAPRTAVRALDAVMRMATIVTPNADEAAALAGMTAVRTLEDAEAAARVLRRSYRAVLITGGHVRTGRDVVDVLAAGAGVARLRSARIAPTMRGTGCVLACGIAASLARGRELRAAVNDGRRLVRAALRDAAKRQHGRGTRAGAGVGRGPV